MATRRMFSKSITNSSRFLMMSQSAQNLYFHFGMNADDDGFCEHFTIMRMTESKPDDLGVLQVRGFVKVFDDKVLIINDWKENNYLRSDRYTPSKYLEIYKDEIKKIASNVVHGQDTGIPVVDQMATQVRLGKVRLGKDRKENTLAEQSSAGKEINEIIFLFKEVNPSIEKLYGSPPQRKAIERMLKVHGREKLETMIKVLPTVNRKPYWPKSTTPCQLEDNLGKYKFLNESEKENKQIIIT